MEGVAKNVADTSWCHEIAPRLSHDGTAEYLASLDFDPRVKVVHRPLWNGKLEMVNFPLKSLKEPCLLWQIDSDEIWNEEQIMWMRLMFKRNPEKNEAMFYCRYFVGPDIITVGENCYGNNLSYEWKRVWRFEPGMKFESHEPPVLGGNGRGPNRFSHEETRDAGLVFDHFAYATEKTVRFKQEYYGRESGLYKNAVNDWRRLQANTKWPVTRLKDFLPWVDDRSRAMRI